MVSFLIVVIIHRDPSRFACPIVISHSTKADFFTRGYIKGNKQNICSFENDSKPSIGEIFECSQDVCGISGYAEVLPLYNALCRVHLRMGLKNCSFFQVVRQHCYVQNDRHFLANGTLLGFVVYLENASECLSLHAR